MPERGNVTTISVTPQIKSKLDHYRETAQVTWDELFLQWFDLLDDYKKLRRQETQPEFDKEKIEKIKAKFTTQT